MPSPFALHSRLSEQPGGLGERLPFSGQLLIRGSAGAVPGDGDQHSAADKRTILGTGDGAEPSSDAIALHGPANTLGGDEAISERGSPAFGENTEN